MKLILRYRCEICGTEYDDYLQAQACEALGLPEPMPFLPWDKPIPAFGENGVEWAQLRSVRIRRTGYDGTDLTNPRLMKGDVQHIWWVTTEPWVCVSHNFTDDDYMNWRPARAFDPRFGWSPFRYERGIFSLRVWETTLQSYGFSPDDCSDDMKAVTKHITAMEK